MGSPQDLCLTCQVSERTRDVSLGDTSVHLIKTRSHEFSVETPAGAEQMPDCDTSSPPKCMFDTGHPSIAGSDTEE